MKTSIKRQFAGIFILLMTGVIFLCWIANTLFLEKYYIHRKVKVISNAYTTISKAAASDSYGSEEFQAELNRICNKDNISAFVMDADSYSRYASENGGRRLEMRLYGYILGLAKEEGDPIKVGPDYVIQRTGIGDSGYLEMYGRLKSGISFIMQTPLESIRESADMANHFFFYVGLLGAIGGGIIIWLISAKITGPILALNRISERMVHLDFNAKYRGKLKNEIGLLGENMNKLSNSLETSISELKTANNELRRDIEKKEKIDEMRKEFLSNVSHELKTPLALIQGYAEGLQEGMGEDPENRDFYCEVIVDEATKMNTLVQKLLTLNQLEFGNDMVNIERFDVVELLQAVVQSAKILSDAGEIQVELRTEGPLHVWADEFQVEEVLQNYLSNAIHYCTGEKQILITGEQRDKNVRITVFNTGDPIPEESLDRIWDKFYKVDKARTREYGGSGVGLSIVKAIMESMNQSYGVKNCSDGVEFWFELDGADA